MKQNPIRKTYTQDMLNILEVGGTYEYGTFDNLAFINKDLSETSFSFCTFRNCNFSGAKCNNAIFTNCDFSNSHFQGANLFATSFTECKLIGIKFYLAINTSVAKFKKCILDYSDFRKIDFSKANFDDSSCIEANYSYTNLEKASFVNADLTNADFYGAKHLMTDVRGATITGMSFDQDLKGFIMSPGQIKDLAEEFGIVVINSAE